MASKIRLDNGGIAELLKSAGVAAAVASAASAVEAATAGAPELERHGMTVSSTAGVSDRARSIVTIMHPGGLGVQAKHGTLSKAVASAGLELRSSS